MERSAAELGDGGVEVDERLGRHAGAAPATLLPDRRDGVSGQGRVPHARGRLDALHRHAPTVGPLRLWSKPQPEVDPHATRRVEVRYASGDVRYASTARGATIGRCPATTHSWPGCARRRGTVQPRTVALRRALHRRPELGLDLPVTRDAVLAALADLPLQVHLGRAVTSVVAVLEGARPGPDRAAARRHGRPPAARGHRPGVRVRDRRGDARVRARHARRDARLGRPRARRPPRRHRGPGAADVPARRGGLPRRPLHDRRGAAGRARPRRTPRTRCTSPRPCPPASCRPGPGR